MIAAWISILRLSYDFSPVLKGNRSAMPLSRIALQSPAGAARGQVSIPLSYEKMHFLCIPQLSCLFVTTWNIWHAHRLMTFVMKQMSFLGSRTIFTMSWPRTQDNLLRRLACQWRTSSPVFCILQSTGFRWFFIITESKSVWDFHCKCES